MQKKYPFKFLNAYTREDSDFFFGRSDEIEALYEMVFQTDLLLVYGASGTGKTSLIQCGLASKFQSHDWLALNIRRSSDLNASFEKALQDAGGITAAPADNLDWLDEDWNSDSPGDEAAKNRSPLALRFKAIYLKHFKPLYLIFDQFEELYILGSKEEQRQFIQTVKEILLVEQPVKIILSIREEYLGYLYEFERAVPELLRKKLRVEPMNLDKVKTVIKGVGSLKQGNVRLQAGEEDAIAEGIFEKIRGEEKTLSIQLPYLQVFLDKLYLQTTQDETRKADAVFTPAALEKMGDIGDVLRNFLDEQVLLTAQKLSQQPETIWRILSPFVTLEGTKEPLSAQNLFDRLPEVDQTLVGSVLQAFVDSRILRYTENEQLYEIAHDSLAKQIHAKRSDEEIAILEVQRLIKSQVALKPEAREFFTEKQLLFIEPYLSKFKPGAEEQDWIEQSRARVQAQKAAKARQEREELENARQQALLDKMRAEEAERLKNDAELGRKRARVFAYLAGVVAVAAIGMGVFAFFKQQEASVASEKAKQEEIKAKDALTQVNIEKTATEAQRLIAVENADLASQNAKKAEAANALAQTNLAKAKAEEVKTKAALEQVTREQTATEAQRLIAEDNYRLAQEQKEEATIQADAARRALAEQQKAVAAQQAALADIARRTILDAQKQIYRLDYETALATLQSAAALAAAQQDVSSAMLEIAFFYTETGRFERAKVVLDTAARLAAQAGRDLTTFQKLKDINSLNTRVGCREAIKTLNSDSLSTFDARYFPIMLDIPGGTDTLGSGTDRHAVTLSPYKMAKTETTWWQYNLFCEARGKEKPEKPGWDHDGDNPVVNVSWYDAVEYANWLSVKMGADSAIQKTSDQRDDYKMERYPKSYRLPTEAEWEYAARAGTDSTYAGSNQLEEVAWYGDNSGSRTHPVATKKANAYGLNDMSGNVWEWCWDWYKNDYYEELRTSPKKDPSGPESGSSRVVRGGSWVNDGSYCRVTVRGSIDPRYRFSHYGFRVAQDK